MSADGVGLGEDMQDPPRPVRTAGAPRQCSRRRGQADPRQQLLQTVVSEESRMAGVSLIGGHLRPGRRQIVPAAFGIAASASKQLFELLAVAVQALIVRGNGGLIRAAIRHELHRFGAYTINANGAKRVAMAEPIRLKAKGFNCRGNQRVAKTTIVGALGRR